MTAPHGACSEESIYEMGKLGFEALCISRGSLRHYNSQAPWIRTLGMRPVDSLFNLPVIPRFGISQNCENAILIAALLHQPIITVGHHQDLMDGLGILSDLSRFVNSLGQVQWRDLATISRSQYSHRIDGKTLHLKIFSQLIDLTIPEGVESIFIHRMSSEFCSNNLNWFITFNGSFKNLRSEYEVSFSSLSGQKVRIVSDHLFKLNTNLRPHNSLKPWPVVRRFLTESRDRLSPLKRYFTSRPRL